MKFAKSKYDTWYHHVDWKKTRENHLKDNWKCVNCESTNQLNIDHIIEFDGNEKLFLEPKNLQTLCVKCHYQKTNIDNMCFSKPDGDWKITIINEQDEFLYKDELEKFGINNVLERYSVKISAESLQQDSVVINAYHWNLQQLRMIIIKLIVKFKSKPATINNLPWAEFWVNYFENGINTEIKTETKQEQQPELKVSDDPLNDILKLWGIE